METRICTPTAATSPGGQARTAARLAHGMYAGVSTAPCSSVRRPVRALPSSTCDSISNLTCSTLSSDQHRVSVAVESVVFFERLVIGLHQFLAAAKKRRDHHEER